jgi:hypothetical protein
MEPPAWGSGVFDLAVRGVELINLNGRQRRHA